MDELLKILLEVKTEQKRQADVQEKIIELLLHALFEIRPKLDNPTKELVEQLRKSSKS